ncbi:MULTISPECIES: stage II sporulation protein R [Brevibacillus]|uniref:stage II sporulation protein R n=1 Tax=Brevibacillus TaxID=55080 RepID=UPI002E207B7F|nr:stage II sporulation protein R [Brevibacillus borstelensis]MED1742782.1 stage II sporulation protein R [Brevibacillus borstelensis]MED1874726.1 stage II sporulation protein R [Brevibacillus borstelensis]
MKRFFFVAFSFLTLMMSWEGQLTSANVLDNGPIPQESIRLRIIANSDSIQDQWLKREVRDAIVDQMNVWVKDIRSYDEAKAVVASKLPELQALVDKTMRERGFSYKAEVDFGRVPFPTKLYGSYVYPAGDYEALRVRIGDAQGQNWWCVLFPPLCFIDMSNGDAIASAQVENESESLPTKTAADAKAPTADLEPISKNTGENAPLNDLEEERASHQQWRLSRMEESWMGATAETNDHQDAGDISVQAFSGSVSVQEQSREDAGQSEETAPVQPKVEVRFYLWDKLASLF